MSSILALPDEVLLNILSQVIEAPDDVRMSASKVDTYTPLFASSAIHVNRKLRQIALSAIASSTIWVELSCRHGKTNWRMKEQEWNVSQFCCLPSQLATVLPQNRPTIRFEKSSTMDLTSPVMTYIFPYCLEALLHLRWLMEPEQDECFQFVLDCARLPQYHHPIIQRDVLPVIETLRFSFEVKTHGSVYTGAEILDSTEQSDQALLESVHIHATAALRHFCSLINRNYLDAGAIFIYDKYLWLTDWMTYRLPVMGLSPTSILNRLRTPDWRSDLMLKKFLALSKSCHAIRNLAWWAAIHLRHGCTEFWAASTPHTLGGDCSMWHVLPMETTDILGLSDLDLSERYLVFSEALLRDSESPVSSTSAQYMLAAFCLSENPEYQAALLHMANLKILPRGLDYESMFLRKHYIDFDANDQEFIGSQALWDLLEGSIDVMPRARSLVENSPEVEAAREVFHKLRRSLPVVTGIFREEEHGAQTETCPAYVALVMHAR